MAESVIICSSRSVLSITICSSRSVIIHNKSIRQWNKIKLSNIFPSCILIILWGKDNGFVNSFTEERIVLKNIMKKQQTSLDQFLVFDYWRIYFYIDKLNKYQVINTNRYIEHFLSLLYRFSENGLCASPVESVISTFTVTVYKFSL